MQDVSQIIQIKEAAEANLLKMPGVTAVDVGYKYVGGKKTGEIAIRVHVAEKKAVPPDQQIPETIDGVKTDVLQNQFTLVAASVPETDIAAIHPEVDASNYNPLLGGISIGPCRSVNNTIYAGTLGAIVVDNASNNNKMMLSNFHVMCIDNGSKVGDTMVQPSRIDRGSCPNNVVGALQRSSLGGQVDCAVASITARGHINEIAGIGYITGTANATLGLAVQKRGRTTGATFGTVDGINMSITIDYGNGLGKITLTNQIFINVDTTRSTRFIDHGDSGSLAVSDTAQVIGLLFAQSDANGASGVANPIQSVLNALNISMGITGLNEFSYEIHRYPYHMWTAPFTGPGKAQLLAYLPSNNWWLGSFSGTQLGWTPVGNTFGFGNISSLPFWVGDFTGLGKSEVMFYYAGDGNWWLGTLNGTQLNWSLAGNTAGFGNISSNPFWVEDFTGSGKKDILFFSRGDKNWWLGTFSGTQLSWSLAGNTAGFGDTSTLPTWIGDFTGSGKSEIMFYYAGDGNWWLGTFSGTQLNWSLAGNTAGFGNISSNPFWVGGFTGPGKSDILFFSRGDKNWWLGTFNGMQLGWTLAGNTSGFGDTSTLPTWIGDFTGSGKSEIMFYYAGDGNWWLGTFNGTQLGWTLVGNTSGFGNISTLPFWVGDFTSSGKSEIMFYYGGDGNWWLGTFSGTQLGWTLAGNTTYNPSS